MIRSRQRISRVGEQPDWAFSVCRRIRRIWVPVLLSACFLPMAMAQVSPLEPYCQAQTAPKGIASFPSTLDTALLTYKMCLHSLPFHPERRKEGQPQDESNLAYAVAVLLVADERGRYDPDLREALIEEFHRYTKAKYRFEPPPSVTPAAASMAILLERPSGQDAGGGSLQTQAQTIRNAHLIRDAVIATNRFGRVFVLPNRFSCMDGFAAELCLEARLASPVPETPSISWRLTDSSGEAWMTPEQHTDPPIPSLDGLPPSEDQEFSRIAENLVETVDARMQSGELPMPDLELLRKLRLARHFQPALYEVALSRQPNQSWRIQQPPDTNSEEWRSHIEGLADADMRTSLLITERYAQFANEIHEHYQNGQTEILGSAGLEEELSEPMAKLRQDIDHLTALRDSQYERFRLILERQQ